MTIPPARAVQQGFIYLNTPSQGSRMESLIPAQGRQSAREEDITIVMSRYSRI